MAQLGVLTAPARAVPTLADQMAVHTAHTAASSAGGDADAALVKAAIDALDAREWHGFLSRTSDDIVVDDAIFPAPFAGRRQVQGWCETWARNIRSARTNVESIRSVGPFVLLETIVVGTLDGELAGVAAAARPFTVHRGLIVRIANGRISRLTAFMNRKELADAVGYTLMPRK
jgi:hypothetical protein